MGQGRHAGRPIRPGGAHWHGPCRRGHRDSRSQLHQQPFHDQIVATGAVAIALLVAISKGLLQLNNPSPSAGLLQRPAHLQPLLAAGRPDLQPHPNPGRHRRGAKPGKGPGNELGALLPQQGQGGGPQGQAGRALQQPGLLGHAQAVGRQHPGQGVEQHPLQAQQLGQAAGVLTSCSAETHQQGLAQVVAALN